MKVLLIFATLAFGLVLSDSNDRTAFNIGFNDCISITRKVSRSTSDRKAVVDQFTVNPFIALNYPGGLPPEDIQVQFLHGWQACFIKYVYAYDRLYPEIVPELPLISQDLGDFQTQLAIARRTGASDDASYFRAGANSLDGFKSALKLFVTKPNGPYGTDPSPSETLSQLQNAYNIGFVESNRKFTQGYNLLFDNNIG